MTETSYIIDLTPDGRNRYRHYHKLGRKEVIEFGVQYEAYLQGRWHTIVRYDTAHGFAHRDVMHPDSSTTKTPSSRRNHGEEYYSLSSGDLQRSKKEC